MASTKRKRRRRRCKSYCSTGKRRSRRGPRRTQSTALGSFPHSFLFHLRGSSGSYVRHLASLWESTYLPPSHPLAKRRFGSPATLLNTIDHLVLLDLLGNSHSQIFSYYRETDWLFEQMASADRRLREAGLVEVEQGEDGWFGEAKMHKGMIGDDHTPVRA